MSNYIEVMVVVEGKTEEIFVKSILSPYLSEKSIYMFPTQVTKPGEKGGDVRFSRVKNDLEKHLKQRTDTYVTTLIDYYGTKDWPGLNDVEANSTPEAITMIVNNAAMKEITGLYPGVNAEQRFIPYLAIHEFEALLFCGPSEIAFELGIQEEIVHNVLKEFGTPEEINNNRDSAPSKRLDNWSPHKKFPKTTTGISIARNIGIQRMRNMCPLFDNWIKTFEDIVAKQSK